MEWTSDIPQEILEQVAAEATVKTKRKPRTVTPKEPKAPPAAKAPRTPRVVKEVNPFADALKFISLAYNGKGRPDEAHCIIRNGWIVSSDSLMTCGHPINLGADINPNIDSLKTLLDTFSTGFTITAESEQSALFRCGDFSSHIPCIADTNFTPRVPDPAWGPINKTLADGFKALDPVLLGKGELLSQTVVRLDTGTMTAFSGKSVMQFWHGWTLPVSISIPKVAAKAVVKCGKELVGIGYHQDLVSVTFYFSDGAWLKTQVHNEAYPNFDDIFQHPQTVIEIPEKLFEKATTLNKLDAGGTIFFREGRISSYHNDEAGSSFAMPEITATIAVQYEGLMLGKADLFDKMGMSDALLTFTGPLTRLAISGLELNEIKV